MINKKILILLIFLVWSNVYSLPTATTNTPRILLVMGSTRQNRMSERLAKAIMQLLDNNKAQIELLDLRDYSLPIVDLENPIINEWVDRFRNKVMSADALLFLIPNYNAGYPGIFKNAIDTLHDEWKNKVVGLIGYSGGFDGGKEPINAIVPVLKSLQMQPIINKSVYIPFAEGALNELGEFSKPETKDSISELLYELYGKVSALQGQL